MLYVDGVENMKVVILCGGQGTRIRDVSEVLPKPMLPIGNMPILWHIMKIYSHFEVNEFVLCLGYKGWLVKEFFLNYFAKTTDFTVTLNKENSIVFHDQNIKEDWKVTLVETGEMTQTGARIWNVRKYVKDCDIFSVTYGDGVADIDIRALIKTHKSSGLMGTITGVHPSGRFGEIEVDGYEITKFHEKPNVNIGMINGGFMIFDKNVLDTYFRMGDDLILEEEILPKMVKDRQLGVYKHNSFWQCVDTPREFNILNEMWKTNNPPWKIWK